jgi:hypothetical protein
VILEAPNSNLRPLQIPHDSDFALTGSGRYSQGIRSPAVIIGISVRKIQTRNIHAGNNHFAQCFAVI